MEKIRSGKGENQPAPAKTRATGQRDEIRHLNHDDNDSHPNPWHTRVNQKPGAGKLFRSFLVVSAGIALLFAAVGYVHKTYFPRKPRPTSPIATTKPAISNDMDTVVEETKNTPPAGPPLPEPEIKKFTVPTSPFKVLKGHTAPVSSLAFLTQNRLLASASEDGTIKFWNLDSGALLRTLSGHRHSIHALAAPNDGHLLASSGNENYIIV